MTQVLKVLYLACCTATKILDLVNHRDRLGEQKMWRPPVGDICTVHTSGAQVRCRKVAETAAAAATVAAQRLRTSEASVAQLTEQLKSMHQQLKSVQQQAASSADEHSKKQLLWQEVCFYHSYIHSCADELLLLHIPPTLSPELQNPEEVDPMLCMSTLMSWSSGSSHAL